MFRRYGFKCATTVGGIPFGALAAQSNTNLKLILGWFQLAVQLYETQAGLADAEDRLRRR